MKYLLLILLISCGQSKSENNILLPNDNYFYKYKIEFIEELSLYATEDEINSIKDKVMSFHIYYIDLEKGLAGRCFYGSHIEIDLYDYNNYSMDLEEKTIVFHELAHCVLNMPHFFGGKLDLMSINILPYDFLTKDWIFRWLDSL